MERRIFDLLALILTIALMIGCGEKVDLEEYIGDGKAEVIGNQTWYPGFKVTFNKFDFSKPFSGEYSQSCLINPA